MSIINIFVGTFDVVLNFLIQLNVYEVVCWIYLIVFLILFCISCFGRQIGLRKKYINFLLKIFEFGSNRIKKKRERRFSTQVSEDESEPSMCSNPLRGFHLSMDQTTIYENDEELNGYHLEDILPFITTGVSTIVEDEVIPQFVSEKLPYWNLLSRTNTQSYEFISIRLTVFWVMGFIIRYFLLLPLRIIILFVGLIIFSLCTLAIGPFPEGPFKREMNSRITIACFDFVAGCLSLVATFHNEENKPSSGLAVANHTSPIDSMVLATDNCYDMVGQKHGGLLGIFMSLLSRSSYHIWFERSESKDRNRVAQRLREHASNPDLPPILIFPEGVCVNNTSVMQFRKGAFEAVDEVHPIAIKFDARFGDAFWWQDQFLNYVLCMMTSWAIVCDVWYLPAMTRGAEESPIDFAKRVKSAIAIKGGLTDVSWDGFLKAAPVKGEWRKKYQSAFARRLVGHDGEDAESSHDTQVVPNLQELCSDQQGTDDTLSSQKYQSAFARRLVGHNGEDTETSNDTPVVPTPQELCPDQQGTEEEDTLSPQKERDADGCEISAVTNPAQDEASVRKRNVNKEDLENT